MSQKATLPPLPRSPRSRTAGAARKALAICGLSGAAILAILISAPASAATPAAQCEGAARTAAQLTGVPAEVLAALALTESGRARGGGLRPWPWTVNIAGDGQWFDSRDSAIAHARAALRAGKRNVDIGCFQINYRWHASAFDSLEAMFDPQANALYAARFLRRLEREFGDWEAAAGAYHSRTPELAERYVARFRSHLGTANDGPAGGTKASEPKRQASARPTRRPPPAAAPYPLLAAGAAPAMGSLVPGDAVASRGGLLTPAAGKLQ